jgi:7,8-dihydroneopterin aldolase/epimerase/oxygenase
MSPHDPALKGCRLMFLRGLSVQARIGIHDFELQTPQRLIIDIDVYVDLGQHTPKADQIQEVVDYDFLRALVHRRVARGHIHLQETLCDDVLTEILLHPAVKAAQVSTRKPDVYPDCEAVGVQTFKSKI